MPAKFWRSRYLLLMLLPALIWYIVFMYAPMYGAQIAFRDFSPVLGINGQQVGRLQIFHPVL